VSSGVDVFTVPGYTGSGPRHWQTLWEQLDRDYRRVEQDDWNDPRLDLWVGRLDRAITGSSKPIVLLAHSLGCLTVVHWVARGLAAARVRGALLVVPPDVEREDALPELRRFAPIPMIALPFFSIMVATDNDPYASLVRSRQFAHAWGTRIVVVPGGGHMATADGYGPPRMNLSTSRCGEMRVSAADVPTVRSPSS